MSFMGLSVIRRLMFTHPGQEHFTHASGFHAGCATASLVPWAPATPPSPLVVTVDPEPHPFDQIKLKYDDKGRKKTTPLFSYASVYKGIKYLKWKSVGLSHVCSNIVYNAIASEVALCGVELKSFEHLS